MTQSPDSFEPTPLPHRDFNQELEKTCGAAHALELALRALFEQHDAILTDRESPPVQGVLALAEVLADRLEDLEHMNAEEQRRARTARALSNECRP